MAFFNGYSKDIGGATIVFATFQTMLGHLDDFPKDYFGWMTVDETHHAQAETYRKVIDYFDCSKLGITATPDREDLKDIRDIFGEEVYNLPLEEAIARNLLPAIEYHLLTEQGLSQEALEDIAYDVIEDGRRVSLAQINRRLFIPMRDKEVASVVEAYDERTVVFCSSIAHTTHFQKFLKSSATYHSDKFRHVKKQILKNFREGMIKRLLVVDSFNEGVDFPDVSVVVFYRATESKTIFLQQLGRGLRPGKKKVVVLDFVGNLERVRMVKDMIDKIVAFRLRSAHQSISWEEAPEWNSGEMFNLIGDAFKFSFSNSVVNLLEILKRVDADLYPTWDEAGAAAQALGIESVSRYAHEYRKDPRLPSNPYQQYPDFPGWPTFLNNSFYTYDEASKKVQELGIVKVRDYTTYTRRQERDKRLPTNPPRTYKDKGWKTWNDFFGKAMPYSYEEASRIVQEAKIETEAHYLKYRKQDPRLPAWPSNKFKGNGWTGWPDFLGRGYLRKSSRDLS